MHKLLRHSVSIAAAGVMLTGMVIGAAAQDDENDGVVTAIPLPEECVVEPRDEADIAAVLEGGEHQFVLPDGLPVPLGDPANGQTRTEATELVRHLVACLNAGDAARGAALFSDNGLRGFYGAELGDSADAEQAPSGTPTARAEETYLRLRAVTDVSVLEDDRVAAFVVINDPLLAPVGPQTLLFVFSEDDEGFLVIDGTLGFSELAPAGTPTP